jgi:hypothetical protein
MLQFWSGVGLGIIGALALVQAGRFGLRRR